MQVNYIQLLKILQNQESWKQLKMLWKKLKTQKSKQKLIETKKQMINDNKNKNEKSRAQKKLNQILVSDMQKQNIKQIRCQEQQTKSRVKQVYQSLPSSPKERPKKIQAQNKIVQYNRIQSSKVTQTILINPSRVIDQQAGECKDSQSKYKKQSIRIAPTLSLICTNPPQHRIQGNLLFNSFSLGRQKIKAANGAENKKQLLGFPQILHQQMESKTNYSANSFNKNKKQNNFQHNLDQNLEQNSNENNSKKAKKTMKDIKDNISLNKQQQIINDFFRQMQEAGIDISDLGSNQRSKQNSTSFKNNDYCFTQTQRNFKPLSQDKKKNINKQLIQSKQKNSNSSSISPCFNSQQNNKSSIRNQKLQKLRQQHLKTHVYLEELKLQLNAIKEIYTIFTLKELQKKKKIKDQISIYLRTIEKAQDQLRQEVGQKRILVNQQAKTIEQLRYRVLKHQSEKLQKQTTIMKQAQIIREAEQKNYELNQIIFDLNQKIIQSELVLKKRVSEIVDQYELKLKKKQKDQKLTPNDQNQICRLSEQVEQLTKLYQHSQQQHKKVLQTERQKIAIQMQRLQEKQRILLQRQINYQQRMKNLEQDFKLNKLEKQIIVKQHQQIQEMQQILESKFHKVEQIQQQLNNGFQYLETCKQQLARNQQQVQNVRLQLMKKTAEIQRKTINLQLSKANNRKNQLLMKKQKSLVWEPDKKSQQFGQRDRQQMLSKARQKIKQNQNLFTEEFQKFDSDKYNSQLNTQRAREDHRKFDNNIRNYTGLNSRKSEKMVDIDSNNIIIANNIKKMLSNQKTPIMKSKINERNYNSAEYKISPQIQKTPMMHPNINYLGEIDKKHNNIFKNNLLHNRQLKYNSQMAHSPKSPPIKNSKFTSSKISSREQSPKYFGSRRKQPEVSSHKLYELDSKIQSLRKQIKKQIVAAKSY